MAMAEPSVVTDEEILDFLREVAVEGYGTDDEVVDWVTHGLVHEHPGQPDLRARVEALAPLIFDELQAREAAWPIPTDNDRLDRAFASLDRDGILTRQNWYRSEAPADEEMAHEVRAARCSRPIRGFAYFHGGDVRRALAGEGLRITWDAVLPPKTPEEKRERSAWDVAQDVHRALWAQGLSPDWSRVVGDPITLPFTWRRRRRRRPALARRA